MQSTLHEMYIICKIPDEMHLIISVNKYCINYNSGGRCKRGYDLSGRSRERIVLLHESFCICSSITYAFAFLTTQFRTTSFVPSSFSAASCIKTYINKFVCVCEWRIVLFSQIVNDIVFPFCNITSLPCMIRCVKNAFQPKSSLIILRMGKTAHLSRNCHPLQEFHTIKHCGYLE